MTGSERPVKRFMRKLLQPNHWPTAFKVIGSMLLLLVLLGSIASSFFLWPVADEADYLLQARNISQGLLPYRDFFVFMTPLGQIIVAGLIKLMGLDVFAIRLIVLLGWAIEWLLLFRLARQVMPLSWTLLLLFFLWNVDTRYLVLQHHFWSGLFGIISVYQVSQWLLNGRQESGRLVWAGIAAGCAPWCTQSLGAFLGLALLAFSIWDSLLPSTDAGQKTTSHLVQRWWQDWGKLAVIPALSVSLVGLAWLYQAGILNHFFQDTLGWLSGGHYARTTVISPWATFQDEWDITLLPLRSSLDWDNKLLFIPRIPTALCVAFIFCLPIGVLCWAIYQSAQAARQLFLHKTLGTYQHIMTLWAFCAIAMTTSTFTYATSMHVASNSGLVFLLAFLGMATYLKKHLIQQAMIQIIFIFIFSMTLIGSWIGTWMHFNYGVWLPNFRPFEHPLLYINGADNANALIQALNTGNQAARRHESVLVLYQSPELYLAGDFKNPSRYTLILPQYTSQSQIQELMADIQQSPPAYIIDDNSLVHLAQDIRFSHFSEAERRIPDLETWRQKCYKILQYTPHYTIYAYSRPFYLRNDQCDIKKRLDTSLK